MFSRLFGEGKWRGEDGTPSIEDLAAAFDSHLARIGRAPRTRVKYRQILRIFARRLGARSLASLSALEIDGFLSDWEAEFERERGKSLSRATARNRICALRSFFDFAERFGLLVDGNGRPAVNPMRMIIPPPQERKANDWLQSDEDRRLLDCDGTPTERIVVVLLRWTGMRVGEACQLLLRDVDLTPGVESVNVRKSKTPAGQRRIAIVPELLPQLERWLSYLERHELLRPDGPFLATRKGTAMKPQYVSRLIKRVAHRADVRVTPCTCGSPRATRHAGGCPRTINGENLSRVTAHTLRRTFASDLLNRGLRLEVVAQLLGHSSVVVTQTSYAELLDTTARRELLQVLDAGNSASRLLSLGGFGETSLS
jgi:integrase